MLFSLLICDFLTARPPLDESKALSVDKLKPPDHLDGLKLEQDGHLNKDFHKEAFLGNHEEIDDDPEEIAETKLKDIFYKVDTDADGELSVDELESWIMDKINSHLDEALEENDHIFKHLDPDGDGAVDWKEYYMHFLMAKGYPLDKAEKHMEDYDVIEMKMEERDQLVRYKFRWTDADTDPVDNKLSKTEFLSFRHPEQSKLMLENMLQTLLNSLDRNDDGKLDEEEFSALPPGEVEDEEQKKMDREWQEERRAEFKKVIDSDRNGVATKEELMAYVDPRNPHQGKSEANNLISMLDDNKNGKVSLKEVLHHKDIFINSKVCDVKRILHDEF
ncbi:hypothetical protein FSP39_025085 [Pinctada imbricata]|uniref:45 kDa calcium-binding protein n=1 Tax=Pinctada imbricata TaxID=66713 RepID=A0AA89C4B6_PINIB|nr:hypothetical protein FSP39_025085 [Pinctada imbricata]